MKKILSISLALVMLVCLCMSMVSCEQDTAFSKYYSYLEGLEGGTDTFDADDITTVIAIPFNESGKEIALKASVPGNGATISVTLYLTENTSTYHFLFQINSDTSSACFVSGEGSIDALSYTGNEMVVFDEFGDYTNTYQTDYYENQYRSTASSMLKTLVLTMKPMMAKADVNIADFYFISVDFPESDGATEEEVDLGGALSAERWVYVGQMLVVGLGMVFLVLAILWIVLLIFEKAMGTKQTQPQKKAEPTPTPVVTEQPVAPPVVQTNDAAVVAAITAAIAAMIDSDERLSEEFAGGFRVVSFRKKSGRGSWND